MAAYCGSFRNSLVFVISGVTRWTWLDASELSCRSAAPSASRLPSPRPKSFTTFLILFAFIFVLLFILFTKCESSEFLQVLFAETFRAHPNRVPSALLRRAVEQGLPAFGTQGQTSCSVLQVRLFV